MRENTMEQHEAPLCDACRRIPISHLALDVAEPIVGWEAFFEERNVQVFDDAIGRPSVPRYVLGDLLAEQRARDARLAEEAAAKAATLEQPVAVGVPALDEGATAYETMMSAGSTTPQEEFAFAPKPNFVVEELEAGQRRQAAEREAVRRRKEPRRNETR
jgi:hypothetical protein